MRLITRNCYPVHIWNVSEYVKQTQANIIKQDSHRFLTIHNIFKKLYLRHLHNHEQVQQHITRLNDFATMSQAPARSIADYFHTKGKFYSEGFMTATFQHLARAYQISKSDHAGTLDTLGYKLFLSSEFSNLSEQFKYALRNNKVSYNNIVTIVESLIKLEYVDYEIINMLMLYTEREINSGDQYKPLSDWPGDRQYQIEKMHYYNPQEEALLQGLRGSPEINTAISFVRHIYQEWEKEHRQQQDLKAQNINEINELISSIADTNKNFRKVVEGIISIRREYLKMVEFSSNEVILRNPNLNLDLLLLEEKLLSLKLLSIQDIKNTSNMKNSDYEVRRVQEILLLYLDVQNLTPIFAVIDKSPVEVEAYTESRDPDSAKIAKLLNLLSRIASLDRFVYHTGDGRSLVNLKWEKTLLEPSTGPYIASNPLNEELKISRIFRRVYRDILDLFGRSQQKVSQLLKVSSSTDKILFLDAFCRLGLHERAIVEANQFQSGNSSLDIADLDSQTFSTLIHLFNDIGIFINNEELKEQIFNQLSENLLLQQNNKISVGVRQTIDTLNYLLQNHKEHTDFTSVYNRYLNILESKAIYFTPEEHENELLIEAFKILALDRPEKFGSHPVYLNFIYSFVNDSHKKNPYHSILRETCYKLCRREKFLNKMQTHLSLGVSNGMANGLIFSNSDETSLDGEIRSGDLNSYIIRLSSKNNMLVHEFSINSLLDIDYSNNKQLFKLRPMSQLEQKLGEVFERQTKPYDAVYQSIEASIVSFLEVYPDCLVAKKIKLKLAVIQQLRNSSMSLETKEQEYTNNALFLIEILELNKLVRLLEEGDILPTIQNKEKPSLTINSKLDPSFKENEYEATIPVDINQHKGALREVKSKFFQLIEVIRGNLKESLVIPEDPLSNVGLKGERQTLEVIGDQSESAVEDVSVELLNHRYFNDKTFCEYRDWKQLIESKYNLAQLDLQNASNLCRILVDKFCPEAMNKVTLLPICKHSERLKRLNLEFKLLKDNYTHTNQQEPALTVSENKELDYIINLLNFKHELKTTFTSQNILDYIFGFKFILDIKNNPEDPSKMLLRRDPEEYFNYLEELHERNYLDSPYANYIIQKLSKTDQIRTLIEKRKEVRLAERLNYQKGLISASTYYEKVNVVEQQLLKAVEQLKTKMLDNMDHMILSGQLKMLDIKKDELEAFEEIIQRNFSYSRQFDNDFIVANGNYQKAIHLKRGRAQNNYIKLYLLKKLGEKKPLNGKEAQLLKDWHEDIVKDITQFTVYDKYTTMLISELPWEDLQSLRLKSSSLNSNKDMLVVDLIMEFNLFLNESLIQTYQRRVKAEHFGEKYHIPQFMFDQSSSNSFKQLENEVEQSLISEHSQLRLEDIDTLEEIFKIFKTEGFKERNRYQSLCKNFKANITEMSHQTVGPELIQEYIRVMEDEFIKEYDPSLVKEIKQKQTDKLWREIFHHPYDNCTKELLRDITKKLILRMELLQNKTPPFFGQLMLNLLMHPNLDALTKQSLIAALEVNKIDLGLDSSNIQMLLRLPSRPRNGSAELKTELAQSSRNKLGDVLYARAKELL